MGVCFVVWTLRPFYEIMGTDVLVEDVTTYEKCTKGAYTLQLICITKHLITGKW
jgi:hypothetical protein